MTLFEWLKENDKSLSWLGREVGRTPSVMSRLAHGHIRPTNDVVARIELLTRWKVTAVDIEATFQERRRLAEPARAAS